MIVIKLLKFIDIDLTNGCLVMGGQTHLRHEVVVAVVVRHEAAAIAPCDYPHRVR